MFLHETTIDVRYAETDAQGVVHYAVYAEWFELARINYIKQLGYPYDSVESDGFFLPVVNLSIRYRKPAFFGDTLTLTAALKEIPTTPRVTFVNQVLRGSECLASGEVQLVCINDQRKITPLPAKLLDLITAASA